MAIAAERRPGARRYITRLAHGFDDLFLPLVGTAPPGRPE
jgi:hypothetical protein